VRQAGLVLAAYAVLVLVVLKPKHQSPASLVLLLVAFGFITVPMTYYMQRWQYRMAQRRGGAAPPRP